MPHTLPGTQMSKTEEAGVQVGNLSPICEAYTLLGTPNVL